MSDRILGALAEAGEKEAEEVFALQGMLNGINFGGFMRSYHSWADATSGALATFTGRRATGSRRQEPPLWQERAERAARRRAALDATLSQPAFASAVKYAAGVEID